MRFSEGLVSHLGISSNSCVPSHPSVGGMSRDGVGWKIN